MTSIAPPSQEERYRLAGFHHRMSQSIGLMPDDGNHTNQTRQNAHRVEAPAFDVRGDQGVAQ
jgi:hypothetical protein